jgi:hypothetical protein
VEVALYIVPQAAGAIELQGVELCALNLTALHRVSSDGTAYKPVPVIAPPWGMPASKRKSATAAAAAAGTAAAAAASSTAAVLPEGEVATVSVQV